MTVAALEVIIYSFCKFSNNKISFNDRKSCMEAVLNCSISGKDDGSYVDERKVEMCKETWLHSYKTVHGDDYGGS